MSEDRTFVIVGASLAGAKAAETLREEGFEGRVVLLGEEPARPYERPPLSKDYLQGKSGLETIFVHEEQFYAQHNIELRTSTVARSIDLANRDLLLATDERIRFDSLLLTTGSTPRRIQLPGERQGRR
jgi:3-phenylpropionate/trans-cinnamate dioxygenase ferredoxin reductase subunit